MHIWNCESNPRFSMVTEREEFVCIINAGVGFETFISVGYSSPNFALCEEMTKYGRNVEAIRDGIAKAVQAAYDAIEHWPKSLEDTLPILLSLCKVANNTFNRLDIRSVEIVDLEDGKHAPVT